MKFDHDKIDVLLRMAKQMRDEAIEEVKSEKARQPRVLYLEGYAVGEKNTWRIVIKQLKEAQIQEDA